MLARSFVALNSSKVCIRCFSDIKKSNIYTKTGDKGSSSLYNGERRKKYDDVFQALGDTDELNSFIGLARGYCEKSNNGLSEKLIEVQSRLFDLGAAIATPTTGKSDEERLKRVLFTDDNILRLEHWIDELDSKLPPFKTFTIPSSYTASAHLQVARSVCRRAERHVVPLVERGEVDPVVQRYLNRLSDFLYVCGRWAVNFDKIEEIPWVPHKEFKKNN
ncbi:hypothetical protein WA158_008515 [Blastocystis sp. Blastoise]